MPKLWTLLTSVSSCRTEAWSVRILFVRFRGRATEALRPPPVLLLAAAGLAAGGFADDFDFDVAGFAAGLAAVPVGWPLAPAGSLRVRPSFLQISGSS